VNVPLPRKTAVDPLSVAVPVVALLLKSLRPPLITVFATSKVPATTLLPSALLPVNDTVPSPVTLDATCRLWSPAKLSCAPLLTTKLPLLVPPPKNPSVPVCAWTEPELLNATAPVIELSPAPADFVKLPALLKADGPPNEVMVLSLCASKVAPLKF
jgi:hypothetical protein